MYLGENNKNTKNQEISTKMTRKQALFAALTAVEDREARRVIQEMIESMPLHEWNLCSIDDAIEQYKVDHGHYPKPSNFKSNPHLPNPSTVQYRTGMPLKDYIKRFYTKKTNSVKYFDKPKEEWLKIFQSQFDAVRPKSAADYNARRDKSTPTWNVTAQMFDTKKWNELLTIAQRDIKKRRRARPRAKLFVKSYSDIDFDYFSGDE